VRSLEFEAKLDSGATLKVPDDFAAQIGTDQPVRVILVLPDSTEEQDWRRLATEQFLRSYAAGDSIYDNV
jgi:hypothetical protein